MRQAPYNACSGLFAGFFGLNYAKPLIVVSISLFLRSGQRGLCEAISLILAALNDWL